jgi:hypothetical protein
MFFAAKMKFEGLTSVSTTAHFLLFPRNSKTGNGTSPERRKVSRSNFILDGGRNWGVANDVFRRKNEI